MKNYLAILTAALLAAGAAHAAGPMGGTPGAQHDDAAAFQKLDKDGDGVISRSEAERSPALSAQFDKLDKNQDGVLDEAEFAQFEEAEE